jgi:hypothetical protein
MVAGGHNITAQYRRCGARDVRDAASRAAECPDYRFPADVGCQRLSGWVGEPRERSSRKRLSRLMADIWRSGTPFGRPTQPRAGRPHPSDRGAEGSCGVVIEALSRSKLCWPRNEPVLHKVRQDSEKVVGGRTSRSRERLGACQRSGRGSCVVGSYAVPRRNFRRSPSLRCAHHRWTAFLVAIAESEVGALRPFTGSGTDAATQSMIVSMF